MGAPKSKWTAEEESALRQGVAKYGPGKWRAIQKDPKFGPALAERSNVDLKDKWRNMNVAAGIEGTPKLKGPGKIKKPKMPKAKKQLAAAAAVPDAAALGVTAHTGVISLGDPMTDAYPAEPTVWVANDGEAMPVPTEGTDDLEAAHQAEHEHEQELAHEHLQHEEEEHLQGEHLGHIEHMGHEHVEHLEPAEPMEGVQHVEHLEQEHMEPEHASHMAVIEQTCVPEQLMAETTEAEHRTVEPERPAKLPATTYEEMTLAAVLALQEKNGSSVTSIVKYIEDTYEVDQKLRKQLPQRLKLMTDECKLTKVSHANKTLYKLGAGEPVRRKHERDATAKRSASQGKSRKLDPVAVIPAAVKGQRSGRGRSRVGGRGQSADAQGQPSAEEDSDSKSGLYSHAQEAEEGAARDAEQTARDAKLAEASARPPKKRPGTVKQDADADAADREAKLIEAAARPPKKRMPGSVKQELSMEPATAQA
eukprot:jgi/Chlat1/154/Chrsp1S00229